MVQTNYGHHHHHKRQNRNREISSESYKKILDKLVYIFGMLGPVFVIPQIVKIYAEQNATSISLFTWTVGGIPQIIWLLYGIAHKEKPLIILNIFWILVYVAMSVGKLLYG